MKIHEKLCSDKLKLFTRQLAERWNCGVLWKSSRLKFSYNLSGIKVWRSEAGIFPPLPQFVGSTDASCHMKVASENFFYPNKYQMQNSGSPSSYFYRRGKNISREPLRPTSDNAVCLAGKTKSSSVFSRLSFSPCHFTFLSRGETIESNFRSSGFLRTFSRVTKLFNVNICAARLPHCSLTPHSQRVKYAL